MREIVEIIREIKRKREFSLIYDKLIRILILRNKAYKRYLKTRKKSDKKLAIKQVRALLRKVITPMPNTFYRKFNYFLKHLNEDKTIDYLLVLNRSTLERSEDSYLWLIGKINEVRPNKLYDVGCGLNLLALWKFCLDLKKFHYLGFDVDGYIVRLVNEFSKEKNLNALSINTDLSCLDLKRIGNKNSMFLILKLLDALEEIKLGVSKEIIAMNGKKIISFSLKSLSGKSIRQRFWFEKLLKEHNKSFEKVIKDNEVFYLVDFID